MIRRQGKARGLALLGALLLPATAQAAEQRNRETSVNVVAASYVDTYLRRVPIDLVTANLDFEKSYLVSVGVNRVLVPKFSVLGIGHNSLEAEVQVAKHFEGQDHLEGTAALVYRTGEAGLFGGSSLNGALGLGFSYATQNPEFEFGPARTVRGLDTERFQFYIGVEAELTPERRSPVHMLLKLHHRSGGYGLISPSDTGSNFVGLGLRFDLNH
jgi:hypothetical protein